MAWTSREIAVYNLLWNDGMETLPKTDEIQFTSQVIFQWGCDHFHKDVTSSRKRLGSAYSPPLAEERMTRCYCNRTSHKHSDVQCNAHTHKHLQTEPDIQHDSEKEWEKWQGPRLHTLQDTTRQVLENSYQRGAARLNRPESQARRGDKIYIAISRDLHNFKAVSHS